MPCNRKAIWAACFSNIPAEGSWASNDLTVKLWQVHASRLVDAGHFSPDSEILALDGIPRNVAQAELMQSYIDVKQLVYSRRMTRKNGGQTQPARSTRKPTRRYKRSGYSTALCRSMNGKQPRVGSLPVRSNLHSRRKRAPNRSPDARRTAHSEPEHRIHLTNIKFKCQVGHLCIAQVHLFDYTTKTEPKPPLKSIYIERNHSREYFNIRHQFAKDKRILSTRPTPQERALSCLR